MAVAIGGGAIDNESGLVLNRPSCLRIRIFLKSQNGQSIRRPSSACLELLIREETLLPFLVCYSRGYHETR